MFSLYFTTSYFPAGWGAVGDLPEGSMSGGTTLRITVGALLSARANIEGDSAFAFTAQGTASASEAGGSAHFSISATGTLTSTGQAASPSMLIPVKRRKPAVRPGELRGLAALRIEAIGVLDSTVVVVEAPVQPVPEVVLWTPPVLNFPAPVAFRPVQAFSVPIKVEAPKQPVPGDLVGSAYFSIQAEGLLTFEQIKNPPPPPNKPPPVEPYDDTEEIVLALLMLKRAA